MSRAVALALLAMLFAGLTAIVAKKGLAGVSSDAALVARTAFVFGFALLYGLALVRPAQLGALTRAHYLWARALRAVHVPLVAVLLRGTQIGDAATVAAIDKGSLVVTVIGAALLLGEPVSRRTAVATLLVASGLVLAATAPKRPPAPPPLGPAESLD